jgi:hypothetical protein
MRVERILSRGGEHDVVAPQALRFVGDRLRAPADANVLRKRHARALEHFAHRHEHRFRLRLVMRVAVPSRNEPGYMARERRLHVQEVDLEAGMASIFAMT